MNAQAEPQARLVPAASVSLDRAQMTLVARVESIIEEKDAHGQYVHSAVQVRDFMIACIFELGLPLTRELALLMQRFLENEITVAGKEPSADDVLAAVRSYFVASPLSERLNKAFLELGREQMFGGGGGFRNDAAHRNAVSAATGMRAASRAPMAAMTARPTLAAGKVRRGLS